MGCLRLSNSFRIHYVYTSMQRFRGMIEILNYGTILRHDDCNSL